MGLRRSGFVRAGFRRVGKIDAGGITTITSTGGSVTITNPTGPTTNIEVAAAAAKLAAVYNNGAAAADQTATIKDAKGGAVIFDGSTGGLTGPSVIVKGTGGATEGPLVVDGGDIAGRAIHLKNSATTLTADSAGGLALAGALVSVDTSGGRGFQVDATVNLALGFQNPLARNAVNGFPFIRSMPGSPTGVPAATYGSNAGAKMAPIAWDSVGLALWAWDTGTAAWVKVGGATAGAPKFADVLASVGGPFPFACAFAGAAVGDIVVGAVDLTGVIDPSPGSATPKFEAIVTVANQVQQTATFPGADLRVPILLRTP